ncbi:PKD domain-containing protein [Mongoliibacter sp.]|uniref:PKD domain-containing protein n=1 Tax=Mongoliibacter sp. TaxID=2022438 RepID=UPI0025CF2F4F|nr:PKD domain-containing protein [Mongoliibacter sp.]
MKNFKKYLMFLLSFVFLAACVDDNNLDDAPPTSEDARFSFASSSESDNIINFTADNEFFLMQWDLGNGSTAEGRTAQGIYPNAGTYTVTLTIFNNNGSASFSTDVVIDQDDPSLMDSPIFNFLTGGAAQPNGKTWVVDANRDGHFGVGPNPSQAGDFPEWYAAKALEKEGSGMYTDEYTFQLDNTRFIMETNGFIYLNEAQASEFPEAFDPGVGDLSAPYTAPDNLTWSVQEPEGEFPVLTISAGGFIGYFAGTRTYQIINLEEDEMFLRFVDGAN